MSIIIGADIVPYKAVYSSFSSGDISELFEASVRDFLNNCDYRIFNLETPLADQISPIEKQGKNYIAPQRCINGLKSLRIDLFTLANNHIMDQDADGLVSTLETLNAKGISHVGAGCDLSLATEPFFFSVRNKRYGIYACAEHEFSIADERRPGANPFDPLESFDSVEKMKLQCDYGIVLYHGGKEYYPYPSPELQKICRKFIEKGADLVICQHSHCIGCKESYLGGNIIYGQGDFYSTQNDNRDKTSLIIKVEENGTLSFIPLIRNGETVKLAEEEDKKRILQLFDRRSIEIEKQGFVERQYKNYAQEEISNYIVAITGIQDSCFYRILNKFTGHRLQGLVAKKFQKKHSKRIRNIIECEAHRELILKGLKK